MRFSERVGARPPRKSGLEEASPELRVALWNLLHLKAIPQEEYNRGTATAHVRSIWSHLSWRTDKIPWHMHQMREELAREWFSCKWPEFFDLVEHTAQLVGPNLAANHKEAYAVLNSVLESQGCAYRFIGEELAPITNPVEMAQVAAAAESAIPAVAARIREALRFLPPNHKVSERNSIKESISAVEAAVKHLTGDAGATLTGGLSAFEEKYGQLHPSLRQGMTKLYGYTSDEKGVQHALIDETASVTVDDARFMLVACSAFANYLVAVSGISRTPPP